MSKTAPAFLIDTNVWLDYELGYSESYEQARAFFRAARRGNARMGIAAHSLKDVFYIARNRAKAANREDGMPAKASAASASVVAWAIVDHILESAEVVGLDFMDAHIAQKQRALHDDYEDNLVVAAAMRMKADILVTSDAVLLKHAPVATLSPDAAMKWLAAYED